MSDCSRRRFLTAAEQVLRALSTSKWWQVWRQRARLRVWLTLLFQGRLRGKIGLFPSNFVAPTALAALDGDELTDAEAVRLQAQLKLMPL